MAALVHFAKHDATQRLVANSSALVEIANYTVTWANLTAAGFAAGDDVLVIVMCGIGGDLATMRVSFQIGVGSTFAGRTQLALHVTEPDGTGTSLGFCPCMWFDRRTLAANQNFYFAGAQSTGADDSRYDDFAVVVLKLGQLTENVDFRYAEATHAGNVPTAYGTTGASVTIPSASNNWLVLGHVKWLIDDATSDCFARLEIDGAGRMEQVRNSEEASEEVCSGLIFHAANPANGAACRVQFRGSAAVPDVTETKIFLLRLAAFNNHAGAFSATAATLSALDTFVQAATASLTLGQTGDTLILAQSIGAVNEATKNFYGRIQADNVDFPVAGFGRASLGAYAATDRLPFQAMGIASLASGARAIDLDVAEDSDVSPTYNAVEHALIALSLELAAGVAVEATRRAVIEASSTAGIAGRANIEARAGALAERRSTVEFLMAAAGSRAASAEALAGVQAGRHATVAAETSVSAGAMAHIEALAAATADREATIEALAAAAPVARAAAEALAGLVVATAMAVEWAGTPQVVAPFALAIETLGVATAQRTATLGALRSGRRDGAVAFEHLAGAFAQRTAGVEASRGAAGQARVALAHETTVRAAPSQAVESLLASALARRLTAEGLAGIGAPASVSVEWIGTPQIVALVTLAIETLGGAAAARTAAAEASASLQSGGAVAAEALGGAGARGGLVAEGLRGLRAGPVLALAARAEVAASAPLAAEWLAGARERLVAPGIEALTGRRAEARTALEASAGVAVLALLAIEALGALPAPPAAALFAAEARAVLLRAARRTTSFAAGKRAATFKPKGK